METDCCAPVASVTLWPVCGSVAYVCVGTSVRVSCDVCGVLDCCCSCRWMLEIQRASWLQENTPLNLSSAIAERLIIHRVIHYIVTSVQRRLGVRKYYVHEFNMHMQDEDKDKYNHIVYTNTVYYLIYLSDYDTFQNCWIIAILIHVFSVWIQIWHRLSAHIILKSLYTLNNTFFNSTFHEILCFAVKYVHDLNVSL